MLCGELTNVLLADPEGAFSSTAQRAVGEEQAAGMGTGGSLNPPVGESFTGESSML